MKHLILAAVAAIAFTSCQSTGGMGAVKPKGLDTTAEYTIYLTGDPTFYNIDKLAKALGSRPSIKGKVVDLKGGKISGKKLKHPRDRNDENAVALRTRIPGLTIKNGIIEDIPGGIVNGADNCIFQNLIFLRIGEDAWSNNTDKSRNNRVINCTFINDPGGDKSAQWNDGRDGVAKGNYITGGITAIRIQESTGKARNVKFRSESNTFVNVPTAHNVDGDTVVRAVRNKYTNVQKRWVVKDRARVDED